jgi:hypothetical protein
MASDLEDAAVAYVEARIGYAGADGPNLIGAQVHLDECYHDLALLAVGSCDCDPGTCPGLISTTRAL